MPRHHTISYRDWIEASISDEGVQSVAHWSEPYQLDVPFTAEEERARDAEEAKWAVEKAETEAAAVRLADAKASAIAKLTQLGLNAEEIAALNA